jgi:hypothetical protein
MFAGSFGPSLAAILVVASTRRVEGLRAWLRISRDPGHPFHGIADSVSR